jgi:hypothetical protein
MNLVKQAIDISFAQGLDQKTDPKRVAMGKFVKLENMVFTKGGLLQKRNGYGAIGALPDATYSYLTTLNDNLTAIGTNIAAYNENAKSWAVKSTIEPMTLNTLPVIRNNYNQTSYDIAIAPNGLACVVYLESDGSSTTNKYAIFDSVTGQNIVTPAVIPVGSGTVSGGMRVVVFGNYFVMMFTNTITAVDHLQYVTIQTAIPNSGPVIGANTDIISGITSASTLAWDALVVGSKLFVAYYKSGTGVVSLYLDSAGTPSAHTTWGASVATMFSITADTTGTTQVYISFYDSGGSTGYTAAVDASNTQVFAPVQIIPSGTILNLASAAQNGVCRIFSEVSNVYSGTSVHSNYVQYTTITSAGTALGFQNVSIRGCGLASKAFIINSTIYYLASYSSPYQPTYFIINGTKSIFSAPVIAAKLAYQNGGGYLTTGLPSVDVTGGDIAQVGYLFKDLITAVNKNTNVPTGTQVNGIYSQTGINLATFTFGTTALSSVEIANVLQIGGGFLWLYDGQKAVEHNFLLYPDNFKTTFTWNASGGSIVALPDGATNTNAYWYQITYEWTDNQGNTYRSAPSIPIPVTTTGSGTSGSINVTIASCRLTMKTSPFPVKICIYRWSVGQQVYYQTTSVIQPTFNNLAQDNVNFTDTNADATILGNSVLYTTGGVVEDIGAPSTSIMTLFDSRLWMVDAEDTNLLWYSKQVIEATPVEMSDLLTVFIPPTISTQGPTGPITALAPMDDKLIISKGGNAFVYINGTGPDNTGSNSQYSPATFITSAVGCANQKSIVLTPIGLMFESNNKGIWLLDRGLGTKYIGAPVEDLTTGAHVLSAVNVPETNQVRFTLDSGMTLMYDYYYDQWGAFVGVPAVSSCIWNNFHAYINAQGAAFQEIADQYMDGVNPVLMMFKTGPLRIGDLQNYQRAYFFYILGEYLSPHRLVASLTYDYDKAPSQQAIVTPINFSPAYGNGTSQSPYGQQNPYGGPGSLENARVFLVRQRCMAFAIQLQEIYDASFGVAPGAGLTLSGLNVVMAFKRGFRPQSSQTSTG